MNVALTCGNVGMVLYSEGAKKWFGPGGTANPNLALTSDYTGGST